MRLVAFDSSEQLAGDLREGWIDSLVVQDPFRMGYDSTRAIALKLRGETPAPYVDTGVRLILREELDQPAVRAHLFPDLSPYLGTKSAHP